MSAFVAVWRRRTEFSLAVAALGLLVALALVGERPGSAAAGPDEQMFIGPAGGGNFAIVMDLSGTQITAVILESVFFGPGPGVQTPCGEITASVSLTAPAQISPVDSSFQFSFSLGAGLTVNVSGKLAGQAASASLFLKSLPCNGGGAEWTGTLIPTGGPGLPACITGDLSGSWDMKTQHGTGPEGHFEFVLTLVQTNSLLSGTMVDGIQITSITGDLNGDVVTFGRLIGVGGPTERTQTYDGLLTPDGTTIAGTFIDPKSPLVGTWVATANCVIPVGGVAFDPDLGALSLTTPERSGGNSRLAAGIAAAAGVVALAGAAWYARKRVSL